MNRRMDLNTRKERFSLAYINAVATYVDCEVIEPKVDRGSVDGFLVGPARGRDLIRFQAKATEQNVVRGNQLHFPLPIRDYNHIRNADAPFVLIVVRLPNDESQWLTQTDDELCLRYCGYWLSLANYPSTANTATVAVHIPLANIFSSSRLIELMGQAARGEQL